MIRYIKYFLYFLFLPFWWIQLVLPRKNNIWVFGAWNGNRFSDNSKYLFQYVKKKELQINVIWLTRSKAIRDSVREQGGTSFMLRSFKGIYYSLLAGNVLVTSGKRDVNHLFINGANLFNLWHGSPLKKIGMDDIYSLMNTFLYKVLVKNIFPMVYEFNYHYTLSNAPCFTDKMASAFGLPLSRILETGCPRNDVFYSTESDLFNDKIRAKFKDCRLIYYLPTFRNSLTSISLFTLEDYNKEQIEVFLEKENMVFVSKGHYIDNHLNLGVEKGPSRIVHLSDEDVSDINFMLKDADLLVTDYSSAYFDFLLTERPIIFAAFDLEEYMSNSRELYFEYSDTIAGPIVRNWEELCLSLKSIWNDSKFKELIVEKNKLYNKYHDNYNSQRVCETLKELIK